MPNIMNIQKPKALEKEVIHKKDDTKFIVIVIAVFLFIAWLVAPPSNKFIQFSYFLENIKYQLENLTNKNPQMEYLHLRNNAVYLAKMYPKQPKRSLTLINKSIEKVPAFMAEKELPKLYKDRAYIKLYLGDKKGALDDFILSTAFFDVNDNLRVAALLTERKQYRMAAEYCDRILENDLKAFYGYACLSYVYESAGNIPTAIALYDLAIDRKSTNPKAYVERARLKKKNNDMVGYDQDIAKAKELNSSVDINSSVIDAAINMKDLILSVR